MANQENTFAQMDLLKLLSEQKVLVCCGTGGVGKTTTAVALSLSATRLGKRVLVLTIDPSKRLAQALGIEQNTIEPVQIEKSRLSDLGIDQGELWAWLLDPGVVSDRVVRSQSKGNPDILLKNSIYQEVSHMVAGMQEYTAVEALHYFINDPRFDLIILDTPPARHALRFLDSPRRVAQFLDKRIFKLFTPSTDGILGKMAAKLIDEVLDRAFGEEMRKELKVFFEKFGEILDFLNLNQQKMEVFFRSKAVQFILITTDHPHVIEEALYFYDQCKNHLSLNFAGIILNKAYDLKMDHFQIEKTIQAIHQESAMTETDQKKLNEVFSLYLSKSHERKLLEDVQKRATFDQLKTIARLKELPNLGLKGGELEGIKRLSDVLLQDQN
jgi:anion-transporting  ArsA/GET3 family ATPase